MLRVSLLVMKIEKVHTWEVHNVLCLGFDSP